MENLPQTPSELDMLQQEMDLLLQQLITTQEALEREYTVRTDAQEAYWKELRSKAQQYDRAQLLFTSRLAGQAERIAALLGECRTLRQSQQST